MIWDQPKLHMFTSRERKNTCQGHKIFVDNDSNRTEFTMEVLKPLTRLDFDYLAKCFVHFWGVETNEQGQFLLLKNGKIPSKMFNDNNNYSITLVPMQKICSYKV